MQRKLGPNERHNAQHAASKHENSTITDRTVSDTA